MAPLTEHVIGARVQARDPRIQVTDIEQRLATRYTADTLRALVARHPGTRFVWLMGADNLIQLPRWRNWHAIFRIVAVAVLARPAYSFRALSGRAARRFAGTRVRESRARSLAVMRPPAWVFLHTPRHVASATRIRARSAVNRDRRGDGASG